jgi:hypothetical protein
LLFDVVGIIKLREDFIGVIKESFFFLWRDFYNHDLPTIDLTYYTYHEIAHLLGKSSSQFENYFRVNNSYPKVNKKVLALLECLKKH